MGSAGYAAGVQMETSPQNPATCRQHTLPPPGQDCSLLSALRWTWRWKSKAYAVKLHMAFCTCAYNLRSSIAGCALPVVEVVMLVILVFHPQFFTNFWKSLLSLPKVEALLLGIKMLCFHARLLQTEP